MNKVNNPSFFEDTHVLSIKNLETYDFTMLATIPAATHASKRNRVIIPDDDGNLREFIILETAQRDKKKKIKTIASYIELKKGKRISPSILDSQTVNMAVDWTLGGTGWQRGITEYAGIRKVTIDGYKDPYQVLKQLASLFELELRFRIEVDGNRIIGRYVDLIKRRGEDTKKETRLGKDLIGVERIENSDIVTALRVLGPEQEDGTRLVVEVKSEEAKQRWARDGEHLWEDYEPVFNEDNVTSERLTELGEVQLAKRINTTVQFTADVVSMEEIFGYTHEKVRLGDTNRIKDTSYEPPLYLEARVIEIHRSISGKTKRKYVLGDFIEYAEEDLMKTFLQLQQLYGAKIIRSNTPPPNPKAGMVWVDTSGERDVIYTWNAAIKDWDKATPTFADEVGAYDKETSDQKEQALHDELTHYTDIVAEEKKQQAIGESKGYTNAELEAKRLALEASMDIIRNDLLLVEQQATNDILALQTRADEVLALAEANQAGLELANGRIVTVEQDINTVDGRVTTTINQLTSLDGVVSQHETIIQQHTDEIALKANQTTVETLTGRVTDTEASITVLNDQVSLKANSADVYTKAQVNTELGKKVDTTIYNNKMSQLDVSISGISSRVSSTETSIEDLSGEIISTKSDVASLDIKADSIISDVSSLTQTVTNQGNQITSANSNISQLSDQITQRVTKTEFDALSIGGRNLIVDKNLSSIGTIDKSTYIINGYIKISAVGTSDGARVSIPNIKPNSKYVLSYSYRKISGSLVAFGGHTDGSFSNNFVIVNGIKRGMSYSQGSSVFTSDDTEIHKVEVHIQTGASVTPTHLIYIQPNRGVETSAVVDIFDLVFVEGNRATDWTPAPEDVQGQIDGHAGRITTAETSILQQANQIALKASQTSLDTLSGRVTTAEANINLLSDEIDLRVEKDGVISSINQSAETIRISASKIHIDGSVTFANGYDPTTKVKQTSISWETGDVNDWVILLCGIGSGSSNYVLGRLYGKRVSGHANAAVIDVVVNHTSTSLPSASFRSVGVQSADKYELITCDYNGSSYVGLRYIGGSMYQIWNNGAYFDGEYNSTAGSHAMVALSTSSLSNVSTLSNHYMPSEQSSGNINWPGGSSNGANFAKERVDLWQMSGKTTINGGQIETDTITAIQIKANEIEAYHIKSLNGLNINNQFVVASNGLVTMRGHLDGATGTFSGAVVGGSFERTSTSAGNRTIINENGIFVQYINSSATTVEQVSLQGNSVAWLNNTGSSVLATMRYSLNSLRINSSIVAIDGSLTTDQINTSDYLWVRRNSVNSAAYFTNQNSGRIAEFRSGAGDGSTKAYFENDGTLVTNRIRGLSSANTVHIGTTGVVTFESKEAEQHAVLRMGTVLLKGLNGSSERFQIRNAADTVYSLLQLGTLQYQELSQFSRREYKKNISDVYINPISLLNELNFKEFHYKEQSDSVRRHLGLILDETDLYFHDATGDGIDTLRLLHVNTMAIQDLDKRDNEQHEEIEALKKQVAMQQQRIVTLENQIAS
ncbi:phage tail spike protein [Sutcliffiella horikoshii]|uniref:phage tail spike protein n=1 Tax=Sutcliffiella horikoshii TaxID=79883 RepID=UPI0021CC60D9|nr:phage tail spike protein [Sutcliffiella horikoshii]